ncbi:LysM peptidoglycan-binding domain-containing protein [Neobacillus sp. OS1-2]|uniref:LysM peptidoglycan-binding domain-containing protein n=1 Tax=Neobacillus sp. OS1-2 TaxID=3070680 RepID=UPI0027E0E5C8|nr:LysM peptidoglycan-binding domain-containing protein [Neobacillus sp. OS1-2]WML40400.1 LysM peptidoglycan-binding domain-containing protein [Neobacillus sp. OS1-2]
MNKEEPYRDQAERLKQRIQKINDRVEDGNNDKLPPREQVHRQKRKKTKWKLKYPLIRLLVLCFILLPIIIFSVISYRDHAKKVNGAEKTSGSSVGYETINLEKSNSDDKTISEQSEETKEQDQVNDGSNVAEETSEKHQDVAGQPVLGVPSTPSSPAPSLNNDAANKQVTDKDSQPQPEPVKNETNKVIYHTVTKQDTLFKIAMKYYQSQKGIEIIKKANKLQSENIYVGQVLNIPLNN